MCKCPNSSTPDTIFYLSDGKTIGLCGYKEVNKKSKIVSFYEFRLFVCGQDSEIANGGWYLQNSKLRKEKDTLILEDCPMFPIGKNFENKETIWTIEKMYFLNGRIRKTEAINRGIRKYDRQEIQSVCTEYENIKSKHVNPNDAILKLAYKLFIATISGDTKARKYFTDYPHKIGLDGYYGEEYNELKSKLSEWDLK
jgi:hypothetical protein